MTLAKLQRIILKNFRLLLRSRTSALIILLGPLILISLIGLAFSNSEPYGVTVATYAPAYNELSNSILSTMNDQRFKVDRTVTEQACIQRVKQAKANICLVFPPEFTFSDNEHNNITFHVDYSKINLVWSVLDVISQKVASRSTEISRDLTGQLVKVLDGTQTSVEADLPKVVDLSIKNTQLGTLTDDITENLNGMELKLDTKEFKIDTLEQRVQLVVDTADNAADRGLKMISDIKANYGAYNMTASQQLALDAVFEKSQDDLENLKDSLGDLYLAGNKSSLIGDLINGISGKLQETKEQLVSASNAREIVVGDAKNAKALLESSLEKLNSIQASLDATKRAITGLQITDPTKIVSPISTTIKPLTVDTHFNYLFPSLIVLILMITGVLLSSMLVIEEKKSQAFFRNFVTPTNELVFTIGTFITALIIMFFQLTIFLIVAGLFFNTNVFTTLGTTGVVLLLVTFLFISIGMLIGTVFQSQETTILAAISCCALLLFLSSTILPLESMPPVLQRVADFNPFVMSEQLLRQTIIFEFGYDLVASDLLLLLAYAVLFATLAVVLGHVLKVRMLYKIHKEKPQKKRMADQAAVVAAKPVAKSHWWNLHKKTPKAEPKPTLEQKAEKSTSLAQKIETATPAPVVQPKKSKWKFWKK